MNVIVTGSQSQLGLDLYKINKSNNKFFFLNKHELDITSDDQIRDICVKIKPKIIINTAAYTDVIESENNKDKAYQINSKGPYFLSKNCSNFNIKLIHISTDFVFDGHKNSPYIESDKTNPLNIYGKTKLDGEKFILINNIDSMIIRTSWLYSVYKENFVLKIIDSLLNNDSISVVTNEIGSPTWTESFAEFLTNICNNNLFVPGVFHYSDKLSCSRFKFAEDIYNICQKFKFIPGGKKIISIDNYKSNVLRPSYSVLSNLKIRKCFPFELYDYNIQLEKMIIEYFNNNR